MRIGTTRPFSESPPAHVAGAGANAAAECASGSGGSTCLTSAQRRMAAMLPRGAPTARWRLAPGSISDSLGAAKSRALCEQFLLDPVLRAARTENPPLRRIRRRRQSRRVESLRVKFACALTLVPLGPTICYVQVADSTQHLYGYAIENRRKSCCSVQALTSPVLACGWRGLVSRPASAPCCS